MIAPRQMRLCMEGLALLLFWQAVLAVAAIRTVRADEFHNSPVVIGGGDHDVTVTYDQRIKTIYRGPEVRTVRKALESVLKDAETLARFQEAAKRGVEQALDLLVERLERHFVHEAEILAGLEQLVELAQEIKQDTKTIGTRLDAEDQASTPVDERPAGVRRNSVAWGVLSAATGALSFVGAYVAWKQEQAAAKLWNDDHACLVGGQTRAQNCGEHETDAHTARALKFVALTSGSLLSVVAIVLLVQVAEDDADASASLPRTRCDAGPGDLGITCTALF